jgi:inosine-uridine nucleoside N-ribohydrolase
MWTEQETFTTIKTTLKTTNIITRFDQETEIVAEAERISTIGGSLGSIGTISQVRETFCDFNFYHLKYVESEN